MKMKQMEIDSRGVDDDVHRIDRRVNNYLTEFVEGEEEDFSSSLRKWQKTDRALLVQIKFKGKARGLCLFGPCRIVRL